MICRESDPTIDLHCPNEAWFRSPPGVPDSERIGRDTLNDHKRHLFNLYYITLFLKVKPRSCLIVTLFMLFYLVFNINGGLKSDEERCVFLGRDGFFGATAV